MLTNFYCLCIKMSCVICKIVYGLERLFVMEFSLTQIYLMAATLSRAACNVTPNQQKLTQKKGLQTIYGAHN